MERGGEQEHKQGKHTRDQKKKRSQGTQLTSPGILNFSDVVEVLGVGDAQELHAMGMPTLLEVPVVVPPATVRFPATDFTLEGLVEAMEAIEPVGYGLAIPVNGEIEGVINGARLLIIIIIPTPKAGSGGGGGGGTTLPFPHFMHCISLFRLPLHKHLPQGLCGAPLHTPPTGPNHVLQKGAYFN
jgi:hypothetical protein